MNALIITKYSAPFNNNTFLYFANKLNLYIYWDIRNLDGFAKIENKDDNKRGNYKGGDGFQ